MQQIAGDNDFFMETFGCAALLAKTNLKEENQ
jgi:hypothetical protein